MRQNCALRIRGLGFCAVLIVASAAAVVGGCQGDIGEAEQPAAGQTDAGISSTPVGAPGEIAGEGGAGGAAPKGGAGGMVADAIGGNVVVDGGGGGLGGSAGMEAVDLVHGLPVTDVAIYQAAKVSLVKMAMPVITLDTPLVRNRPALLRVSVTPPGGWQPRPVVARLQWGTGAPKDVMMTVAAASTDAALTSTFNFDLAAEDLMPAQVQWSVTLLEAPGGKGTGDTSGARIPSDGKQATLPTTDGGPSLKIMLVPIRNANTVPDTSAAQIKFFNDAMFATYPLAKVEVTVRDPIDFPNQIAPQGAGWDAALNQVCMTRQNDRPARNVFYYGLVAPGPFQTYCSGGCVEGIAVLASNPNQDFMRCSMGIGYTGRGSGVFLQEVAHTLGRSHAPCGQPAQVDKMYPYSGARIGVWGYDLVRQRLVDPARTVDFMSYCSPVWISDYTFAHLLPWIQAVNRLVPLPLVAGALSTPELASAVSSSTWSLPSELASVNAAFPAVVAAGLRFPPARWRVATVESDGNILWGPMVDFDEVADGVSHTVVLRDAQGARSTVSGVMFPHSVTGGGMLLLPATVPARVSALQLGADSRLRAVRAAD